MLPTLLTSLLFLQTGAAPGTSLQHQPHEGTWQVETIHNIKVLPASTLTIELQGGNIKGTASCNDYRGSLEVDGTRVVIGELLRTMKVCDATRMSEERDFFSVLGEVVQLELRQDNVLVLATADGRRITARRKETRAPALL